jgi:hypothetical protein
VSETSEAPAPRRCHGSCGLPIPPEKGTTYQVIGPDGTLREFCDGDCLGTYYLKASREGERHARLALVVRTLEDGARSRGLDVVLTCLGGGPWTCEVSNPAGPGVARRRSLEGTGQTIEAAVSSALVPAPRAGAHGGGS